MKITADPKSDQWNADDFIGGPRTFTIAGVKDGAAEQKYDVELVEGQGRVWRPPLTMLRLLIAAWGDEAATWVGRRVTLYRDESIRFGADAVGGIRVSHMSNQPDEGPFGAKVQTSRGRRTEIVVRPLVEDPSVALNAAKRRVQAAAPEGVDLKTWVPAALDARGLGNSTADLVKLAEELEAEK